MKTLNQTQLSERNFWFKNIFFKFAGLTDPSTIDTSVYNTIDPNNVTSLAEIVAAADQIKATITGLKMTDCNDALNTIANVTYTDTTTGAVKSFSTSEIAEFIASFCQQKKIYFDDYIAPKYTQQEITFFKTDCYLGKALLDFECFISQDPALSPAPQKSTQFRQKSNNSGLKNVSKLDRSNAGGILSSQKEIITQPRMYWIGGDRFDPAKSNCPRVHVKPCNHTAPLQVHYSSGQGWDECIVFFKTISEASAFLNKCNNDPMKPAKAQNLQVKQFRTDPNGYVLVSTKFGEAYIYAKKLHEAIEETQEAPIDYEKFSEELRSLFD